MSDWTVDHPPDGRAVMVRIAGLPAVVMHDRDVLPAVLVLLPAPAMLRVRGRGRGGRQRKREGRGQNRRCQGKETSLMSHRGFLLSSDVWIGGSTATFRSSAIHCSIGPTSQCPCQPARFAAWGPRLDRKAAWSHPIRLSDGRRW